MHEPVPPWFLHTCLWWVPLSHSLAGAQGTWDSPRWAECPVSYRGGVSTSASMPTRPKQVFIYHKQQAKQIKCSGNLAVGNQSIHHVAAGFTVVISIKDAWH